ncbi:translocation/assembly module TamB domain-containing protein [Thermocoleostomius sinensis]|uniref:Translocation/assembly module TamB domain-containing protein n=1 Tax=Thermocoleostomius sinensis A174 TaxID=2016057 RepID=A0A9E8ZBP1_9CYAN|nr:translocation/assembly module TamB domain-containing protein [Thermocoleostomius sinensis]WAL58448.1 translocation/assembly module TamB domain-containing protein [Thermocoleostomius sinensis A174]
MTNPRNSGPDPEHRSQSRRQTLLRAGAAVGSVVLVGAAAGGWWAWQFVRNELAPLVARNLSDLFDRPVEVGNLEGVSLTSMTFGESSVPPTATDPDRLTVSRVEVNFNLLEILWDRTLSLDVTLDRPDVYIEQDEDGLWVSTTIQEQDDPSEPIVKIELDTLQLRDGRLSLAPYVEPANDADTLEIPSSIEIAPDSEETDAEERTTASDTPITPILVVNQVNGAVTFREDNQLIGLDITGNPQTGGDLQIAGTVDLRNNQVSLDIDSNDIQAEDIGLLIPLPITPQAGRIDTDLNVQFPVSTQDGSDEASASEDDPDPFLSQLFLNGMVRFQDATGQLEALPQPFTQTNGVLNFRDQQIIFQNLRGRYGDIPAIVSGSLHLLEGYDLTVRAPNVTVANLLNTFEVEENSIPIELTGEFRGELQVTGEIEEPILTGTAENTSRVQVDRVAFDATSTRFTITPDAFTINRLEALPQAGGIITGTGEVRFGEAGGLVFDLVAENLPGDALASAYGAAQPNLVLGNVDATAQVFGSLDAPNAIQTVVQWQAPQATYPGRGQIAIGGDTIRFQDTLLLVAGGLVRGEGIIQQGQWQADVQGTGIALSQFSPELRGLLSGDFRLSGRLDDLSPEAIRAEGDVAFSEGLAVITEPLTASVRWLGDRLQIVQATAPGFDASGFVGIQFADAPGIADLNVNVRLQDYALTDLPVEIPPTVQLAGTADLDGQITGTLDALNVAGSLGLNNLAVNQLAFEPRLAGTVTYRTAQGLNLDVAGTQDRIAVVLDDRNRPVSFFVQQNETIAEGRTEGDRLLATLQNFPLEILNLTPAADLGLGAVGGIANGRFDVNIADLSRPIVTGEVAIANPSIDYITADTLTARFRYFDGVAVLDEGELRRGGSRYQLAGIYNPQAITQFQGKITAAPGRVEDIFAALQWFELADLGRGVERPVYDAAADVQPLPIGMPNATVLNQLRRYSEIVALHNQQVAARAEAEILPNLATLQGEFRGDINIEYSAQAGPDVSFELAGQDWVWGDYQVNQVVAQGGFENGILTLRPLLLQSDDSFLRFTGQVGGDQQSGQLIAENVPVEAIQELARLPLDVQGGILNANAFVTGSVANPQVIGEILLVDVTLNQVTAPPVRSLFGYSNARLEVESRVVGDEADDFQFTASIPYQFPFMTVAPQSDTFSLDLNIRNNGLALISLFTDQVAWRGGEGLVQLQARGTLDPTSQGLAFAGLTTTGNARFENAIFSASALPENITNITGDILFNGDRIQVQTLEGQFSNGQITAQGTFPILQPLNLNDPNEEMPLTISLNNLGLELDDLYDGRVDGQVILQRTALAPVITGNIRLRDGRLFIPGGDNQATAEAALVTQPDAPTPGGFSPLEFEDLQLVLGDRLRVVQQPLLNFLVGGELLINGTQDDLQPEGTVRLRSGQVNLFTTIFNLDRDYENTAVFTPNRGLDPILNVYLVASVPEVTRAPIASTSPFTTSEIAETPSFEYGALQTIRVEASVVGPASQIYNNLELSSSPRRSESEIVALLGGNFINTLGQESGALAIANLAGSTLLTNLQNLISNATGLTDFRLFPTNVLSDNNRTSTLALAAELGFDITNDLSVSVLQILTVEAPTRFGLRYRLTDEFTLRGSTDTEGNSQAVLEFETRF